MINVSFTPRVGVSSGTTTMAINGGAGPNLRCLGNGDGPCLPEPDHVLMTHSGTAAVLPGGGHPQTPVSYGTESQLKMALPFELSPPHFLRGLGDAPFGLSWGRFSALIGAAAALGAGAAYLAARRGR